MAASRRFPVQGFRRCLIAGIATMILHAQASGGDWPQWLGPARNGVSTESVSPWTSPPEVAWRRKVASGFSAPVVADGILVIHCAVTDQEAEEVIALDAATGEERWRETYERAKYRSDLGAGPRATPSIAEGKVYTLGITGILTCLDLKQGTRLWQVNPYDELNAPTPGFGVCSSPVVTHNRVILPLGGEGHGVVAYDALTGKLAWSKLDEPAGTASPIVRTFTLAGTADEEVVVQTTLRLVGLDPADGAVHWEHPLVFQPNGVSPTPLSLGDLLICSTPDTGTLTLELPSSEGDKPLLKWWKQDLSSYFSTGTFDGRGRVLIITNAGMPIPRADILCVDVATGELKWRKAGMGYFHVGMVAADDGRLLLLDDAGNLILGESGDDSFEELCRASVCRGTFVAPALANGIVYVRDDQELVAVRLPAAP